MRLRPNEAEVLTTMNESENEAEVLMTVTKNAPPSIFFFLQIVFLIRYLTHASKYQRYLLECSDSPHVC